MKNKFIKPEIEILAFLCEKQAADSYTRIRNDQKSDNVISLPTGAAPELGGEEVAGGDLGTPYQYY